MVNVLASFEYSNHMHLLSFLGKAILKLPSSPKGKQKPRQSGLHLTPSVAQWDVFSTPVCPSRPWPRGHSACCLCQNSIPAGALVPCSVHRPSTTVFPIMTTCWGQYCILLSFGPQVWLSQHRSQPQELVFLLLLDCDQLI